MNSTTNNKQQTSNRSVNIFNQFKQQQIDSQTKEKLVQAYKKFDSGQLSNHQLQTYITQDLGLKLTDQFVKNLKNVNPNFANIYKGIQKQEVNQITNFKPNTKDDQCSQQVDQIKYPPQYQRQKYQEAAKLPNDQCLTQLQDVLDGKAEYTDFLKQINDKGIDTTTFDKEIRTIQSSNQSSMQQLGTKVIRALNDNQEQNKNQNNNYNALGDSPTRGNQQLLKQATANTCTYNPQILADQKQQDQHQLQQELKKVGNDYYIPKTKAPDATKANKNNGDIFSWKENDPSKVLQQKESKPFVTTTNQKNQSQVDLKIQDALQKPQQACQQSKKIINQLMSSCNIICPQQQQAKVPLKNISQLQGSGNIINWAE